MQDLRIWCTGGFVAEGGREYDLSILARFEGEFVDVVREGEE